MTKRSLRPEEKRAWARVARKVRALPGVDPIETMDTLLNGSADNPTVRVRPQLSSQSLTLQKRPRNQLRPNGLENRSHERKVRRGQVNISASIDLHGYTQASAHDALATFLRRQKDAGARCVLVITGKGRRGEGILRRRFLQWLESSDARSVVSGYSPAHQKHGGGGAWYVFLRRNSD